MEGTLVARLFVLTLGLGCLAWLVVVPFIRFRRRYGSWPVVFHRARIPGQAPVILILAVVLLGEGVLVGTFALSGPAALGLWPVPALLVPAGVVAALAGMLLVRVAQRQLGPSLRMGIDDRPTALVRRGVFATIRNPIYLGILLILAGLAFFLPCSWSVLLWAIAAVGVLRQARLEERHLLAQHGAAYRAYASEVGRFLPGIGRLRPEVEAGARAPLP